MAKVCEGCRHKQGNGCELGVNVRLFPSLEGISCSKKEEKGFFEIGVHGEWVDEILPFAQWLIVEQENWKKSKDDLESGYSQFLEQYPTFEKAYQKYVEELKSQ